MAAESVAVRINQTNLDQLSERQLRKLMGAMVDAIQNLATKCDTLTTKLNADAGVTDTNYATDFASTTAAIVTD